MKDAMPAKVTLLCHTPDPQRVVAAAAKLCYSAQTVQGLMDDLTDEATERFLRMLVAMGHQSPIEHASFTFAIEGVSRALLAQITRHRIASFSVQSQRYVRLSPFEAVAPPQIADCPAAQAVFDRAMQSAAQSYDELVQALQQKHMQALLAQGETEKQARAKAEKLANEDARFVLPNACETRMVVTMNARSLHHFFNQRCCNRAQWEIRDVAEQMLRLVRPVAPVLFENAGPPCVAGPCPEGKMSCGQAQAVRRRYKGDTP